jgi:hypothetical protein
VKQAKKKKRAVVVKSRGRKGQVRRRPAPAKRRPGRPTEYTAAVIADILDRLDRYIAHTAYPIVADFAYKNNIPRQALYEHPEFSDTLKSLSDKKENYLERRMISGIPGVAAGCIFALKNMGWRDKQELEHTGPGGTPLHVNFITETGMPPKPGQGEAGD